MLGPEIRDQVCRLIPAFGVCHRTTEILRAFDALCHESLAMAATERSPEHSRINADGTPFQFALDLGRRGSGPLQFLGEAGRGSDDGVTRRRASEQAWRALASTLDLEAEARGVAPLLATLVSASAGAAVLPASLFWFAVRVPADERPALTIYVNAAWGDEAARWRRLELLAERVEAGTDWRACRSVVPGLAPLGAAITVRHAGPPRARIYLRGQGRPGVEYRWAMVQVAGMAAGDAFDACAQALLGDDLHRPSPPAVFSVDLASNGVAGAKVEFCAHCAFTSDEEARARIGDWLHASGFDDATYGATLAALTGGAEIAAPTRRASLHAYVGVGVRGGDAYASIYLNPGAVLGQ